MCSLGLCLSAGLSLSKGQFLSSASKQLLEKNLEGTPLRAVPQEGLQILWIGLTVWSIKVVTALSSPAYQGGLIPCDYEAKVSTAVSKYGFYTWKGIRLKAKENSQKSSQCGFFNLHE